MKGDSAIDFSSICGIVHYELFIRKEVIVRRKWKALFIIFIICSMLSASGPRRSKQVYIPGKHTKFYLAESGEGSWYGPGFVGKLMANGQPYDPMRYTIAHNTIPIGEVVTIVSVQNGSVAVAEVTDRGPYARGRIADMSLITMQKLGLVRAGFGQIKIYRTADALAFR